MGKFKLDIMSSGNPTVRHSTYRKMLNILEQKEAYTFCKALQLSGSDLKINNLKELLEYKPKTTFNKWYWFSPSDLDIRVKILRHILQKF